MNSRLILLMALLLCIAPHPGPRPTPQKEHDQPDAAAAFYRHKRAPFGASRIPVERYRPAIDHTRRMSGYSTARRTFLLPEAERGASTDASALGTWSPLGPGNIGGRTRALLIHPLNPNILYAAGVSGGVWKSSDAGNSWSPLSDLLMANIAVSAMVMDPTNPNTIYAGTGEIFPFKQDEDDAQQGAGIYKTTDGGATWSPLAVTTASADFHYVSDLAVSPHNNQRVYAATGTGVWRSLDAGATWTKIFDGTPYDSGCLNFAMRGDQPADYLFASCGRYAPAVVIRAAAAETAGTSAGWTTVLNDPHMGRTSLAIAPSSPSTIYAFSMCGDQTLCGNFYNGLWAVNRSTSNGDKGTWVDRVDNKSSTPLNTWLLTNGSSAAGCFSQPDLANQGWYDNVVKVDPVNPNSVWVGGVDLFRSDDGGANWGLASHWDNAPQSNYAHADQHVIVFHPQYNGTSNQILIAGNDGGIFRTSNARATTATGSQAPCNDNSQVNWTSLNHNYAVTQFYDGLPTPDGASYIGGTQDNGTIRGTDAAGPNAWTSILGGDGGFVAIDPGNPSTFYAEYPPDDQKGTPLLYKSTDGGVNWAKVTSGINDKGFQFVPPFLMDPTNSQRLWIGGYFLWRTENGAASWTQAGATFKPGQVSAIAQSSANPDRVLIATDLGNIYRLDNARSANSSTPWVSNVQPRNGYVAWLAFDPTNPNIAYATYSSFDGAAGDAHVYKSTDGGTTWSPIDGSGAAGIPDIPVHTIVVDPSNTARLYIGTDLGVFTTIDSGNTWLKENTGFANVSTEALVLNTANGVARLYAFTHGRGAWRVPLAAGSCSFSLTPSSDSFNASGGSRSFTVLTSPGCGWQAAPDVSWIHTSSTGNGTGTVSYTVDANPAALSRTGHIVAGGQQFTISEGGANCTYSVAPLSQPFPASGGPASTTVTAPAGCAWQAVSSIGWITIASTTPSPGAGNGSVSMSLAANTTGGTRSGAVTIAGISVTITQSGIASAGGNDEIPGATLVSSFPATITQSSAAFTSNPSDPAHSCTGQKDSATAWFRFVPSAGGTVQINTIGSDYDTVLSAYTGTASAGPELACNDDVSPHVLQSAISLTVSAGQSYLIEVSSYGPVNAGGNLVLTFSSNDQPSSATPAGTLPFTTTQSVGFATSGAGDPVHSCTGSADSKTVWFSYSATFTGSLLVDTEGSNYDTVLSVYPSNSLATEMACNDDTGQDSQSALAMKVTSGQTYLIEVSAWGHGSGGTLVLNVNGNDQSSQATAVTATVYQTTQFAGAASADPSDPVTTCGGSLDKTVWFRYTAAATGPVLVSTEGSDYDTVLAVYSGGTSSANEIACNDDISSTDVASRLSFTAQAGQSYLILAGDFNFNEGNVGTLQLLVHPDTPCAFTASPASENFPALGGSDAFLLLTNYPDCAWNLTSPGFVTLGRGSASGIGSAFVSFSVSRNSSSSQRSGSIAVNGAPGLFTVTQDSGTTANPVPTSLTGATTAVAGGTINVNATVVNQGGVAAGKFSIEFYFSSSAAISTASVDTGWGCTVPSLAVGASYTCGGPIGVPPNLTSGTWYLGVIAAGNARVSDSGPVTITGGANHTPFPVSANPASGSGNSQTVTFTFSDPDGQQDLDVVNILVNNFLDGRNACYLAYSRPQNVLYLVANDGGTLLPGLVMNGSSSVSNGQCTVTGAGSSAAGSGTTLTLTLNLSFSSSSFAGNKIFYMAARDAAQNNSGWQALGTFNVPGASTFPAAGGVTPARGSGTSQVFTFTFSDTKGYQDLGVQNVLINNFLDGRGACYLAYVRSSNVLYLVADDGGTLLPGLPLTGGGTVSNSQCTVTGAGSSAAGSGNTLTLVVSLTFSAAFDGNRVIYMAARDATDANNSGWQSLGSWTVQ